MGIIREISESGIVFVVEEAGMLAGYLSAFQKLEDRAKERAIHRLEWSMMVHTSLNTICQS